MGYRSDDWSGVFRVGGDRLREAGQIVLLLAILNIVFVGATFSFTSHVAFESSANQVVDTMLEQEEYEDFEPIAVRTAFNGPAPISLSTSHEIPIAVSHPVDQLYRQLCRTLVRKIDDDADRDLRGLVEFVDR